MMDAWQTQFDRLVLYKDAHGDCLVPDTFPADQQLANWVGSQRAARQNGTITLERMEKLDAIGFVWNVEEHRWEQMFQALSEFSKEHGHCQPRPAEVDRQLYTWLQTQRHYLKHGKHPPERALRLEALGIDHGQPDIAWDRHLAELREFVNTYGHCDILKQFEKEHGHMNISSSAFHNNLYYWLRQQRVAFESGDLPEDKRLMLEDLGVSLARRRRRLSYDEMLPRLATFRQQHGHLNVRKEQDADLRKWCISRRSAKRRGRLRDVYIQALDAIGFPWTEEESVADEMLCRLAAFRATIGHVDVPHELDSELNEWLAEQTQRMRCSQLPEKRAELLAMLGVELNNE